MLSIPSSRITFAFMSAVLLLAYRRWGNLDLILDECRFAGINRIYIHIDCGTSVEEIEDVARTIEKAIAYRQQWGIDIRVATQSENVGCAVSMIQSLDKIFLFEKQIVVLEDDCIPTPDFFHFIDESFREMESNAQIGIACGTQFAPLGITQDRWLLSRYPFNWGWGITKSQWALLSSRMVKRDKLKHFDNLISQEEATYWNAGARRALDGYTDVWDTLLVREMIRHKLLSILPGKNLVRNVGNDAHALHTNGEQLWTNFPTGNFTDAKSTPMFNFQFDKWARLQFFGISRSHLLSTRIRWVLDQVVTKPKRKPLHERIQYVSIDFNL